MSDEPLVSVLLPAFDAENTLATALQSVRRQSFRRWECVVVDDGSTDGTAEIAGRFAQKDSRFRVASIEHSGIVGALARGIERCRGKYVARMDADDLMATRRLARQVEFLEKHVQHAAVGAHVKIFGREVTSGLRQYESWLNGLESAEDVRRDLFVECPIAHPTLIIRRRDLDRHGYESRPWPEDYDLLMRLVLGGARVGVVPEPLLYWRDTPSRLWRSRDEYSRSSIVACKAEYLARSLLAEGDRYVLWGYGDTGRTLARALGEHGKTPSHIVELHPGRLGQTIAGASVIHPRELGGLGIRPLVASVAGAEPRAQIRQALDALGYKEVRDFVCAA